MLEILLLLVVAGVYAGNVARQTIAAQRAEIAMLKMELAQAKADLVVSQRKLAQAKKLAQKIRSL